MRISGNKKSCRMMSSGSSTTLRDSSPKGFLRWLFFFCPADTCPTTPLQSWRALSIAGKADQICSVTLFPGGAITHAAEDQSSAAELPTSSSATESNAWTNGSSCQTAPSGMGCYVHRCEPRHDRYHNLSFWSSCLPASTSGLISWKAQRRADKCQHCH